MQKVVLLFGWDHSRRAYDLNERQAQVTQGGEQTPPPCKQFVYILVSVVHTTYDPQP